jgi:hypothetical protein
MNEQWRTVALGEVMRLDIEKVPVVPGTTYQIAGVLNAGQGMLRRQPIDGAETSYPALHRLRVGQLVMRKLTAWEGPITIVPDDFDGLLVSTEFPTLSLDPEALLHDYMRLVCQQPQFWALMKDASTGTVQRRKRVNPTQLLAIEIQLPSVPIQRRIADLAHAFDDYCECTARSLRCAVKARAALVRALIGEARSDWVATPLGKCAEVLDRFRKPVNGDERARRPGPVPYYGASGRAGWIDQPMFDEVLVLLGEDAVDFADPDAQKAYLIEGPSWVNNHAHVLRAREGVVYPEYLVDALNLVDYSKYATFGTRTKLTQRAMLEIELPVPPVEQQEQIVDVLSAAATAATAYERVHAASVSLREALVGELLSGRGAMPDSYDGLLEHAS